ncbi:DNA repair protein RAD51 homolog 4 [Impatiens glandulifera]|uniref:DNA repair protein RAD51 homolog 4 n=1 Tax=Impatiens glandulifera TaxID=253017 RepID=UPI001FB0DBDD|nr:DNA repair protein RAD51 homolog 4 [Impatiens glandulifera]
MGPLKSLERDHPIIDLNFQHFCSSQGIFSVEDFLISDLHVLAALAEQQPSSERLKQGITEVCCILDGLHQPWRNGMELLEDSQQNKHVLATGSERIDALLHGGLHEGHLTELVGPSSSGKTQICLQAASYVAKRYKCGVAYVDTSNSFSAKRIAHFVSQNSYNGVEKVDSTEMQNIMERITCYSVFDIFNLMNVLHQLGSNLRSQLRSSNEMRLLIIDSVSSLISPTLGGSASQGHALMVSAGVFLKKLAFEHNLSILVTNHMVGGEGGISKPALGENWKSIPHVRLQLYPECGRKTCFIRILRHPCVASGEEASFSVG